MKRKMESPSIQNFRMKDRPLIFPFPDTDQEPGGEDFTDYEEIELGIIPGVSFDRQGNRLGRGKGYYDKLLPLLTHSYNIGICYRFQAQEEIPAEPFDRPMDEVWTEEGRWF